MPRKYIVHLTEKEARRILAEYFECKEEDVEIHPFEHEMECGVNIYITTYKKKKAEQYEDQ